MTDATMTPDHPMTRNTAWPPGDSHRLTRVGQLLRDDQLPEALSLLGSDESPWTRNARGSA